MNKIARVLFPSFLLAAIFVLIAHFEPFSAPDPAEDGFLLELQITTRAGTPLRLFFDRGHGFRPLDSSVAMAEREGEQTVRFLVPPGWHQAWRLEGSPSLSDLALSAARLTTLEGEEKARFEPGRFRAQQPSDRVKPSAGQVRIARGATLFFESPLVLQPPWGWIDSGLQLLGVTALCALVLWKWGAAANVLLQRIRERCAFWKQSPNLVLSLVAAGATLLACHPVIFLGKSYVSPNNHAPTLSADYGPGAIEDTKGSDTGAVMWAHLPYSAVQRQAVFRNHEWPLWNRFNTCGTPLLGQGQSMLGDPFHWLTIAVGGAAGAWDAKYVFARLVFALGIGLLVRAVTARLGVAALLGASSAFIGFFSYRLNHPAYFSLCYAPWILLAWWKIAQAPDWQTGARAAVLLIFANWWELNSGTAKEAAMLLAGLNFTGVCAVFFLENDGRLRGRKLAAGAVSISLFALLSAPFWMTFLDALSRAYTSYARPLTFQISPALLLGLFDDLFYRQTIRSELHVNPAANFFVLLGVLWAVAAARREWRDGAFRALLCGLVPPFAIAFGIVPPSLIERLPFLRNISHIDNTFSCVLIVLLFPLAGLGLRRCLETSSERAWRREWWLMALAAALLAVLFWGHTQALPRAGSSAVSELRMPEKSAFFLGYAPALFVAILALPWAWRAMRRGELITPLVVATLALAALHFRHGDYHETKFDAYVVNPQQRVDLLANTPALELLRRDQSEPGRVLGVRGVLAPGFNAALGLESPASADALLSPYWRELVDAAEIPLIWTWRLAFAKEDLAKQQPIYDALNVRHYLAASEDSAPVPDSLRQVGAADLAVWASPSAWPRAFFTDALPRYREAKDFVKLIANGDGRPFAAVAVEERAAPELPTALPLRRIVPATDYRLTANSTEFVIDAPGAGVVLLAEAFEAGCFRVTLNGQPAPSFRANHLFKAVALPQAGRYVLHFSYEPRVWKISLLLATAGALLLLIALWMLRARRVPTASAQRDASSPDAKLPQG